MPCHLARMGLMRKRSSKSEARRWRRPRRQQQFLSMWTPHYSDMSADDDGGETDPEE